MNITIWNKETVVHVCKNCNAAVFREDIKTGKGLCWHCGGRQFFEAIKITFWARLRYVLKWRFTS